MSASRGVVYIVWDRERVEIELARSLASIKRCALEHVIVERNVATADRKEGLRLKADMYEVSPFDTTLYLDADTVALTPDLSYGFHKADRHGIAVAIDPACFAARGKNAGQLDENVIEYNTGVLFFRKSDEVERVFRLWQRYCGVTENDQIGFAKAVEELNFCPFVLPKNWNFRGGIEHQYFGSIRIFHSRERVANDLVHSDFTFRRYRRRLTKQRILNAAGRLFRR
jgi:hypothetical protein